MIHNRWFVVSVFYLSSALNYLDRQVLNALAPVLKKEFGLANESFGLLLSVFAAFYAFSSPAAGWFLDRVGLNRGISIAVGFWSLAGIARGLVSGFGGLLGATALLGIGESAGIPSTGKASHRYLRPAERSWGPALSNTGLNLGILVAAFLIPWLAENHGWRSAFIVPGALGFVWIPLWLWVSANAQVPEGDPATVASPLSHRDLLRDPQLWGFAAANFFTMAIYAFWTNWTVLYFDQTFGLKLAEANRWAAIPPLVAYAGGLFGAWLAQAFITRRGLKPMDARFRVCVLMAAGALITALVPLGRTPFEATVGIAASLFFSQALGVNFYTLPVDAYGQSRAGFAVAMLTAAFGLLQVVISPNIGRVADQLGSFAPVCVAVAFCPLAGCAILRLTRRENYA